MQRITLIDHIVEYGDNSDAPLASINKVQNRTFVLANGQSVHMAPEAMPPFWELLIEFSHSYGYPVVLSVNDQNVLQSMQLPYMSAVRKIEISQDGSFYNIELTDSHARHRLLRTLPEFESTYAVLKDAHESGEIVTILDHPETHQITGARFSATASRSHIHNAAPSFAPTPTSILSQEIDELFASIAKPTCQATVHRQMHCIPYLYPDNGCWARAHHMCRILRFDKKIEPRKFWIRGDLQVATKNHPNCKVEWDWHVAPIVRSDEGKSYILDPSISDRPLSKTEWKATCSQDPESLTSWETHADVYNYGNTWDDKDRLYDENYLEAAFAMGFYRAKLAERVQRLEQAPPYRCE